MRGKLQELSSKRDKEKTTRREERWLQVRKGRFCWRELGSLPKGQRIRGREKISGQIKKECAKKTGKGRGKSLPATLLAKKKGLFMQAGGSGGDRGTLEGSKSYTMSSPKDIPYQTGGSPRNGRGVETSANSGNVGLEGPLKPPEKNILITAAMGRGVQG